MMVVVSVPYELSTQFSSEHPPLPNGQHFLHIYSPFQCASVSDLASFEYISYYCRLALKNQRRKYSMSNRFIYISSIPVFEPNGNEWRMCVLSKYRNVSFFFWCFLLFWGSSNTLSLSVKGNWFFDSECGFQLPGEHLLYGLVLIVSRSVRPDSLIIWFRS